MIRCFKVIGKYFAASRLLGNNKIGKKSTRVQCDSLLKADLEIITLRGRSAGAWVSSRCLTLRNNSQEGISEGMVCTSLFKGDCKIDRAEINNGAVF